MTDNQKNTIIRLRNEGVTFSKIAEEVNLSINTVKSFYRRNNKTGGRINKMSELREECYKCLNNQKCISAEIGRASCRERV